MKPMKQKWYDTFNKIYRANNIVSSAPINPIYVGMKITERCNQNCKHCWAGKSFQDMRTGDVISAINKIALFHPLEFTITGGEPLLRDDFSLILSHTTSTFPIVEVFTNGTLLDKYIPFLSDNLRKQDGLQISLDGMKKSYNHQRNTDDFELVVKNIENAVNRDISIRINMTITQLNIDDMLKVAELACNLGVEVISFTPVYPLRKGCRWISDLDFNKYYEQSCALKEIKSATKIDVITPIEIASRNAHLNLDKSNLQTVFNSDILHWVINSKGDIAHFLDHYFYQELIIGNIYKDNIDVILQKLKIVQDKVLFITNKDLICEHCNMADLCNGYAYVSNFPSISNAYERCTLNENKQ